MKSTEQNKKSKRKKIIFSFFDPNANEVLLLGDFNGWDKKKHPMKKRENGMWEKHLFLEPGTYEYKFKVDGDWHNDPESTKICTNQFGTKNNFVVVG